jgi:parvulin-like peptidyl-prolyl isomerase
MKLILLLATGILALSLIQAAEPAILARVGDTDISVEDVRQFVQDLDPRERAALSRNPALLSQTVRMLLVQRLVLKEALNKKWEQNPEVARQLARAHDRTIIESYLQSVSEPPESYPGEAEVQATYEANKAALLVPRQYRLAQIYIAVPRNADKPATDKALAKLDAVQKRLKQKELDFAEIAKSESDEKASAERGGEIGWLTEAQIQPEIRPAIGGLTKGAVSDAIRLNDGWHILKVLEIKEAYTPEFVEVRDQLAQQLRAERTKANSQAYLARVLQQNPVSVNELALGDLLKPAR